MSWVEYQLRTDEPCHWCGWYPRDHETDPELLAFCADIRQDSLL